MDEFKGQYSTDNAKEIRRCACLTIDQFEWDGEMAHGFPLQEAEAAALELAGINDTGNCNQQKS
jgi:hypothetical protein